MGRFAAVLALICLIGTGVQAQDIAPVERIVPAKDGTGVSARWPDYQIIVWQSQTAARQEGLKRLGITGGALIPNRTTIIPAQVATELEPFRESGLRPYLENVATDFYAAYHRWTPEHPVTWLFEEARRAHATDPASLAPFIRKPGLSDPAALSAVHDRMVATVSAYKSAHPFYYSLGDETGVADLSANWDFDLSPTSLAAMRIWLSQQYGSLAALNSEWGTHYPSWDAVQPMLTSAAMRQADDNYAAWADFKAWMDEAFARAVRVGTVAVHEADPAALAAIEGAQVPGWGGYDYSRLSGAVDVMEIYPADANMAIARALNPDLILLTTAFGGGPADQHAIWQALLSGSRGLVLWDEDGKLVDDAGAPGPLGKSLAGLFTELRGPAVSALLQAEPRHDPVAVLYSPASFRTLWMLEHRAEGEDWTKRDAEAELADSPLRAAMRGIDTDLSRMGVAAQWISSDELEQAGLSGFRMIVLPHAVALSDKEISELQRFAQSGGVILADVAPGQFDAHSRRRPVLPDLQTTRLDRPSLRGALAAAGIVPPVKIEHPDGSPVLDVALRTWQRDDRLIVAALRDEGQTGPETAVFAWNKPAEITELRNGNRHGPITRISVELDATSPFVFSIEELLPR